jgi:hypothetical protein
MQAQDVNQVARRSPKLANEAREHFSSRPNQPFVLRQNVSRDAAQQFLNLCLGRPYIVTGENCYDILFLRLEYDVVEPSSRVFSSAFQLRLANGLDTVALEQLTKSNAAKWTKEDIMQLPFSVVCRILDFSRSDSREVFDVKFSIAVDFYHKVGPAASFLFRRLTRMSLTSRQQVILNELEGFLPEVIQESFGDRLFEGCQRVVVSVPAWHLIIGFLFILAFLSLTVRAELANVTKQRDSLSQELKNLRNTTVSKEVYNNQSLELIDMTTQRDSLSQKF